jgi:Spy/CpxP family protein refolding chaperone
MKKTISPALALAALFALLVAAVATAQPGRMHGHGRHMDGGRLAEYLNLTEAQKTQVEQLREKTKLAMEPLFEEHKELAEAVRTALENKADAATVGAAVIAAHEHGEKIRAVRDQHDAELAALLTPEQLERWNAMKEARKRMRSPVPGLGGPDHD